MKLGGWCEVRIKGRVRRQDLCRQRIQMNDDGVLTAGWMKVLLVDSQSKFLVRQIARQISEVP